MPPFWKRLRLLDFIALFACCLLVGVATGGVLNAFNGWLSPDYFGLLFYYRGVSASWSSQELYWHSVQQGLKEGFCFGGVIAIVFSIWVFVVSKASCRFSFSALYPLKMVAVAVFFWGIGGFNGVLLAWLLPHVFDLIVVMSGIAADRLKFAWVGGSILGVYFGCLLSLILGCSGFKREWKRFQNNASSRLN